MAVPGFQSFLYPLLRLAGYGEVHRLKDAILVIADQMRISEEDRKELLSSGRQSKLVNRISWARTYLTKAGILEPAGRGSFRITPRGREVLDSGITEIDIRFLRRYQEFAEFQGISHQNIESADEEVSKGTPEELLESSYINLREALAGDLLNRVKGCSPEFFEQMVVDLLVAVGYGGSRKDAGQAIGRSGDGGVDGIIKEDRLGLDVVYIQAKRWDATVGRPSVQAFAGSLMGLMARKGVMITTSKFSQEARDYVSHIDKKIVLIEGEELAQLMIDHDIGISLVTSYAVKKVDLDYFGEE